MVDDDGKHDCPYRGCGRRLPREILACRPHWALVSYPTQRRVYSTWRSGMLDGYTEARGQAVYEMNRHNPIQEVV